MDKRYQIFISSTFKDLIDERKEVMQAVLNRKCIPAGMELFPAIDIKQFEYIKKIIDYSDYYIIILGARYGSLDEDGVGYTEKEYDYAISKKIPVIAFILSDIESIPLGKADTDPSLQKKLENFRAKVQKGRLVNYWENAFELRTKVTESLVAAFEEIPRIGWIRADEVISSDSTKIVENLKSELLDYKQRYESLESLYTDAQETIKELKTKSIVASHSVVHPSTDIITDSLVDSNVFYQNCNLVRSIRMDVEFVHEAKSYRFPYSIYKKLKEWFILIATTISNNNSHTSKENIIEYLRHFIVNDHDYRSDIINISEKYLSKISSSRKKFKPQEFFMGTKPNIKINRIDLNIDDFDNISYELSHNGVINIDHSELFELTSEGKQYFYEFIMND